MVKDSLTNGLGSLGQGPNISYHVAVAGFTPRGALGIVGQNKLNSCKSNTSLLVLHFVIKTVRYVLLCSICNYYMAANICSRKSGKGDHLHMNIMNKSNNNNEDQPLIVNSRQSIVHGRLISTFLLVHRAVNMKDWRFHSQKHAKPASLEP